MAQEKLTPEERLLKMIENPPPGRLLRPAAVSAVRPGKAVAVALKLKQIFKYLPHLSLETINRTAIVICSLVTLFVIYDDVVFQRALERKYEEITTKIRPYEPRTPKTDISTSKMNDILEKDRQRNIFSLLPTAAGSEVGTEEVTATQQTVELKLVGIIWSDNPQAMIEDIKDKKTFLVATGDILGSFKVEKIMRDRVVISRNQQEWELR